MHHMLIAANSAQSNRAIDARLVSRGTDNKARALSVINQMTIDEAIFMAGNGRGAEASAAKTMLAELNPALTAREIANGTYTRAHTFARAYGLNLRIDPSTPDKAHVWNALGATIETFLENADVEENYKVSKKGIQSPAGELARWTKCRNMYVYINTMRDAIVAQAREDARARKEAKSAE